MIRRSRVRWLVAGIVLSCVALAPGLLRGASAGRLPAAATSPAPRDTAVAAESVSGQVESRAFWSASLARQMPYIVYTPPGYDAEADARYPVLFMLHGLGGSRQSWADIGLFSAADRLIREGQIAPLVIVLPEGEAAYWVDHANDGPRWGAYIARDLVAEVDRRYRTLADRRHRAIGGQSMGGHGALQLALNHGGTFGAAGAHSVALRRHETAFPFFGDRASFEQRDPVSLCAADPAAARALTIWIDMGTDDPWHTAALAFHEQLAKAGIAHQWTAWSGGHTNEYWSAHVEDYLRFYDGALARS